ncbi:MAG TPA: universal stress protein [Pyrinomonadaceae bacterium]|nr:universal stress protein [Pyrinomonadaceae bacterium]
MKLLLAVDSITTLNLLLDEVTVRSWPKGTEALVVSVVESDEIVAGRHEMRRREEQITALAVERLRANDIATEVIVMQGDPEELICYASHWWATDLILLRANNRVDVRSLMLGSVSRSLVEGAPCSVEVVRVADDRPASRNEGNFRILLATDGSAASRTASQVVAHTTWPNDTEVKVVSVVNPVTYSLAEIGVWRDKGTDRAHAAIDEAVQTLKNAPLTITGEVIAGLTARGIVDGARDWAADLIVLGTHDRRGVRRLMLSSVSASVATRAHCSVRVVRDRIALQNGQSFSRCSKKSRENAKRLYQSVGFRRAA